MKCIVCKQEKIDSELTGGCKTRCKKCTNGYSALLRGQKSENSEIVRVHKLKMKLKAIRSKMDKTPHEIYLKKNRVFKRRNAYLINKGLKPHKQRPSKYIPIKKEKKERVYIKHPRVLLTDDEKKSRLRASIAKRKNLPEVKLTNRVRNMMYRSFRFKNCKGIYNDMGYSCEDLIKHLGVIPDREMHVDHKIPISWFKIGTHPSIINNLQNLHILSKADNLRKKNKYCHPVEESYMNECFCFIKKQFRGRLLVS